MLVGPNKIFGRKSEHLIALKNARLLKFIALLFIFYSSDAVQMQCNAMNPGTKGHGTKGHEKFYGGTKGHGTKGHERGLKGHDKRK